MTHSRWEQLKQLGLPTRGETWAETIAFHQGYILALDDALQDLDDHGPEVSEYPHHVIRHLLDRSRDEAETSLQAVREIAKEDDERPVSDQSQEEW